MNREQSIEFIQAIEDTKALERAILDIIDELKSEGSKEIADGLEQLIPISNNRFSVIGQKELLQESKRRAISILKSEPQFNHVSEKEACCIVERVLGNVQLYLQDMFKRQPHTKCTDSILSMQKCFDIGNEYDLQHIVYALLRAVFPLARIEEYQDAGACAVRKDICIDEFDIAIELKCTRDSLSAKKLAVERVMIREAIEKCDIDGGILKDTDNPEIHRKNIWTIAMMRREYEVFDSFLNTLDGREYTIMTRHLNEKCTAAKIAEKLKIADKTVSNQLSEIKCSLR